MMSSFIVFIVAISNLLNTSSSLENKESWRLIGRVGSYISKVENNTERQDIDNKSKEKTHKNSFSLKNKLMTDRPTNQPT